MSTPERFNRFYLGFDIGGTKSTVVLGDEAGAMLRSETVETDHAVGPGAMIGRLCGIAERIVSEHGLAHAPPVGISCGGPLDSYHGIIHSPPNLPDWNEIPIVELVEKRLGAAVKLQNDANACALAEWRFGAGRGSSNMIFLTFGTGMGAGLVLNGNLYSGTNDMAGEIGHVRMEPDGPLGYGKHGSFEGFCSGAGIARLAQQIVRRKWAEGGEVPFCRSEADLAGLDARTVGVAALDGDPIAREIIETSGEYLGRGLAILVDVLNPERIVIGSIFVRLEPLLRPRMEAVLRRECLERSAAVCRVVPAALGEDVGKLAALSVAMQPPAKSGGTQ